KVNPDGTMDVTWSLRPDVRWHDGTPLTADDFVFGLAVQQDPETPAKASAGIGLISEAKAPDPHTLVLHWKQTFADANQSGPMDVMAMPRHLLADAYQAGNKQAFFNNPYWTSQYVGLGPYRVGEWANGSQLTAQAFDQYFLGRPKIDRLIIRFFPDVNALVANMLSGDVDASPIGSFKVDEAEALRQRWDSDHAGTVLTVTTGIRYGGIQYRDPTLPWARDARVRQALIHMTDRRSIVEHLLFGLTTLADTPVPPSDPAFGILQSRGLSAYPYDLTRAEQLLNDAGWRRGTDGVYQNAAGTPFSIVAASPARTNINVQETTTIANQWSQAGLAATPDNLPYNAANLNELKGTVKGVFFGNNNIIPTSYYGSFVTSQISSEANRWAASNKGGYSNPAYDRLFEQYASALEPAKRAQAVADMAKMGADEAVWIPLYYDFDVAAFRQGVRGIGQVPPEQVANSWNIHTWEID
ncbi:MAG: peptide/nickel transport system substrate-binding protein, partial [Chloroflexota bacterium]|nr:peptide/nickel transport system substrate-binding protein [Chloroflexota bacterium]